MTGFFDFILPRSLSAAFVVVAFAQTTTTTTTIQKCEGGAAACASVRRLITAAVDDANRARLKGSTHPLARPEYDQGAAPADLPMERMLLVLKRSAERNAALETFMRQQLDRTSPNFHNWLTPEEFGAQYGPADQDIEAVTNWLASTGHTVIKVSKGRNVIEFSGTAATVSKAFHTEIHKYVVNGEEYWGNASDPSIPVALAPAIGGIVSLNNFHPNPQPSARVSFSREKETGRIAAKPRLTGSTNEFLCGGVMPCFVITPYDLAKIYDFLPLWNAGIDGTGETIAVIDPTGSNIRLQDVRDFRSLFGLPPNDPVITLNGPDPGILAATVEGPGTWESNLSEEEPLLDTTWSGAVAKGATINFVASANTNAALGTDLSATYTVDNNVAPIITVSTGFCEMQGGTAKNQFYDRVWQQAAAQGISVFVAAGDFGAGWCNGWVPLQYWGLAVNGEASTPYNVAVGGTDFTWFSRGSYWNSNSDPVTLASVKGYIPETTWNDTCTNSDISLLPLASLFGFTGALSADAETNCNIPQLAPLLDPIGGGGGKSTCISSDGFEVSTCTGGYPKPWWQAGPGVPNDGARDLPDVSLFGAGSFQYTGVYYALCIADENPGGGRCDPSSPFTNLDGTGGTSTATPAMAGIMAMVLQKTGSRQGNPNPIFYALAAQQSAADCNTSNPASDCVFHDVTRGTIATPCVRGSVDCVVNHPGDVYGILPGYDAGPAYDLATGLGTVDAFNLVNSSAWPSTLLDAAGASVSASGGEGTVAMKNCQGLAPAISLTPDWVSITSDSSCSTTFSVQPNTGASRTGSFAIAGQTFTINQESASTTGLNLVGSMPQIASAGGWDTSLTLVNLGTASSEARLNFFADDGSTPWLPFTFPQQASLGTMLGATFDQSLNPNAILVLDTTGPASQTPVIGSSQLLTTGAVDGFAIFKNTSSGQEAVVPLETRNAGSYVLAFDNTSPLTTGLAIANLASSAVKVGVIVRDDAGAQIGTGSIALPAQGHTSFMLTDAQQGFPVTANKRGTIEFDTPQGGQISVLGLRANGAALTSLPVLANVGTSGGTMAHIASGGGWQTTITLVNAGTTSATATLDFFDDHGDALSLPLSFPQTGTAITESSASQTIAAGATLIVTTQNSGAVVTGSAQVTTAGNIGGFAIFQSSGQEAVAPLETGSASSYVLAFDNTSNLGTGIALANNSAQPAVVPVTLRDATGATLATTTINLPANGHVSEMLTSLFSVATAIRGTLEFDTPSGGQIAALGIRATPAGAYTTIPVMTK